MALYLIGGPPKCGKTTLAKKISAEKGIPWISADTLQNIVYAYSTPEEHPALFPHSYLRGETNDEFYAEHSSADIVKNYIAQGKTSEKAIRMMAETYRADENDCIVEGYQVTPDIVDALIQQYGVGHIKSAFLVKHDTQKFIEDVHKSTTPNDWILRKTKNEDTFVRIAEMVSAYSDYFEQEAKKYNLPVWVTDADFEDALQKIMDSMAYSDVKQNPLVPVLYCSSFIDSVRFYTDTLGFSIIYERPESKFCFLARDGAQLMLEEVGADKQWHTADLQRPFGRGVNMQFMTTRVSELFEKLLGTGQDFFAPLEEKQYQRKEDIVLCRQFVVQDPDGYLLRFSEHLGTRPVS